MGFRVVFVENKAIMKMKLDNVVIDNGERESWIPVNDINMIVVDNIQTTITGRTLSLLAQNNIGLIICNQEHLPIGYFSSYDNHSRISKYIGFQIKQSKEFYDKLWKKIVRSKLENQAQCLEKIEKSVGVTNAIRDFKDEVLDGDVTNREAHAAKVYFNEMMGESFSRGNDDIMEPVRPIVDLFAYNLLKKEQFFKAQHREELVNLLNHKIVYKNKKMYLCNMLENYVSDIAAYIAEKKEEIIFPELKNYVGEENEV